MDGTAIIVAVIAGFGSGALGSLVAPWSQGAVETRRARQSRRSELIAASREMLRLYVGGGPVGGPVDMADHVTWLALRAQLSDDTRLQIESQPATIVLRQSAKGVLAHEPYLRVAQEIDDLEPKWKLV